MIPFEVLRLVPRAGQRDLAKEEYWRGVLEQFSQSGLTKSQFCRQEGIKLNALCNWERIIHVRDQEAALMRRRERYRRAKTKRRLAGTKAMNNPGGGNEFVRVHVAPNQVQPCAQAMEIVRPDGLSIKIPIELGIESLLVLLNALSL
jgi:hypothetical protein